MYILDVVYKLSHRLKFLHSQFPSACLYLSVGNLLLFFAASHDSTASAITDLAISLPASSPLMEIVINAFNVLFCSLDLNLVLSLFTQLAPLSGHALDTGTTKIASAIKLNLG